MSSLWTPDGERPVDPPPGTDEEEARAVAEQMAEVKRRIAESPASVIIANHLMGFYELAAIHLSQQPPNFGEAATAIDAMAAVIEKLPGRLGDNEKVLRDALDQIRLAFVTLKNREDEPSEQPG